MHIEPYRNRSAESVRSDLVYAHQRRYTTHPAYYKLSPTVLNGATSSALPVFFVYDSYSIPFSQWSRVFTPSGDITVRGKPENAYVIGLLMDSVDCKQFASAGFNGGYTYFVGRATTFASECDRAGVHFYPSIGPGYDDQSVRPWNERGTVDREDGAYLQRLIAKLPLERTAGVGITSFNEWHEGTQIEPAAITVRPTYSDYSPFSEEYYLRLLRKFVNHFVGFHQLPWGFEQTTKSELDAIEQF
ncbi:unnamed protein product [Echinostoma caproni]|uniref:Uncharacterized protein n=1 Tax=Echinostoma caproni TaxID=27848 RepID=A0A3P8GSJ5_9TREM|nr:unnamed protein product [Echinostoma caproni]